MLKENWRFISRLERLGDFLIIVTCFFLAYHGRSSLVFWDQQLRLNLPFMGEHLAPLKDYFIVLVVALIGYMVTLNVMGAYSSMRLSSPLRLLSVSVLSSVIVFLLLAAILFLLKIDLSRSFISLFCFLVALTLTAERYLILNMLRYWRKRGMNFRNIIIAGVGEQAVRLATEIGMRPELGIRIRGFADLDSVLAANPKQLSAFKMDLRTVAHLGAINIISGVRDFQSALSSYAIDEIIFSDLRDVMSQVEEMILIAAEQGVRTTIAADLFSLGMVKSGLSYFGGMPLIHFQTPPGDRWELGLKRFIDIVVASVALILLSPLFLLIAIAIKIDSSGGVIYSQRRVGYNGRLFSLYKFRSMHLDADKKQGELKKLNEMRGPVFKISNDPRITRVGKFLRRFSLDELPQLWNVWRGDMSLVGPRPPVPGEVNQYVRHYRRRLSMRPGLTCTWQVSGRNEIKDFDTWVKLDLEYIDNWSLIRDFWLLLRTIPAVVFGTGAR